MVRKTVNRMENPMANRTRKLFIYYYDVFGMAKLLPGGKKITKSRFCMDQFIGKRFIDLVP